MIYLYITDPEKQKTVIEYDDTPNIISIYDTSNTIERLNELYDTTTYINHVAIYESDYLPVEELKTFGGSITIDNTTKEILTITPNNHFANLTDTTTVLPIPLYVHVNISGGDGKYPVGIPNDTTSTCLIDVSIRTGTDSTSPIFPVTSDWRVNLRSVNTNSVVDMILVSLINGQASINYKSDVGMISEEIYLSSDDVYEQFENNGIVYKFELVSEPHIKLYRVL